MLFAKTFSLVLALFFRTVQGAPTGNDSSSLVDVINLPDNADFTKYICTFPKTGQYSKDYTITLSEAEKVALMTEATKTGKSGYPHVFGNGNNLPVPAGCVGTLYEYPIYQTAKGHSKQTYWKRDVKKGGAGQQYVPPFRIVYTASESGGVETITLCFVMTHNDANDPKEGPPGGSSGDFSLCAEE